MASRPQKRAAQGGTLWLRGPHAGPPLERGFRRQPGRSERIHAPHAGVDGGTLSHRQDPARHRGQRVDRGQRQGHGPGRRDPERARGGGENSPRRRRGHRGADFRRVHTSPRRRLRGSPGGHESPDRGGRESQQPHLGRVDADVQRGVQGPHGSRPDPDSREGEPSVRRHEPVREQFRSLGHGRAVRPRRGVVRELLREHGIRGCAGVTGGVRALRGAAKEQHVGVMAILAEAGVADAGGQALVVAAEFGREASVKFLIGLQEKRREAARVSYVSDTHDPYGRTPVLSGIDVSPERSCSPRIVRMLIDAGAATSGVARITNMLGEVAFNGTPLSITERILRERKIYGQDATVEQLRKLEAVRRLLLQVAAVRAVSWLWPSDCSDTLALPEGKATTSKAETLLATMLPVLRRRTRKRTALLAPLFRYSSRR